MKLYSREDAIRDLQHISFTREEAERTLDAPDKETRRRIHLQVQERCKKEAGKHGHV